MDTTYTLHTDANGTLTIDHLQSGIDEANNATRGGSVTAIASVTETNLKTLLEYDPHAGSFSTTGSLPNTQHYREFLPSSASINTLVVGLEPNTELSNAGITGVWGLISAVTDNRTPATTNPSVELEIQVLADYTDYADIVSVESDLEV